MVELIFDNADLSVGVYKGNDLGSVVVTFTSLMLPSNGVRLDSWNSFRYGFREQGFIDVKQTSIFFVAKNNDWYENDSLLKALVVVKNHDVYKHSNKRILHGVSMGAYCASMLCNRLEATSLFLGSPQLLVDFSDAVLEKRWVELRKRINFTHNCALDEIKKFKGRKFIFVDPLHEDDMNQLSLIGKSLLLDELYFVDGAGHMAFVYLNKLGVLNEITTSILSGHDPRSLLNNAKSNIVKEDVNVEAIKKAIQLPHLADIYREFAIIFKSDQKLHLSLLKKALKTRPYGPLIRKLYRLAVAG